jgi:hypothetical protein
MGEYKPIGSEKLKNQDGINRILELTYYNRDKNTTQKPKNAELVEHSSNGVYAVVKEKDGYYVKKGINESSLDYIGGMFMKNKNRFSSYAEAYKKLEFLKGQESIQEEKKYVLKQKTQQEAPAPQPSIKSQEEVPAPPMPDVPSEPSPEGDTPPAGDDMPPMPDDAPPAPEAPTDGEKGDEGETKKSSYMSEIQKYSGKLGQELRDQKDRLESDDIKYVLNMVISAVDLDKLDFEDLEDIRDKFDRDEEEVGDTDLDTDIPDEEPAADDAPLEEPDTEEPDTEELGEYDDPMMKLERFINDDYIGEDEIDFSEYTMSESDENMGEDEIVELDLDEINTEINEKIKGVLNKYFK